MNKTFKIHQLEIEIERIRVENECYKQEAMYTRADLNDSYVKQVREENNGLRLLLEERVKDIKRLEEENMRIRQAYNIEIIKNKL